MEMTSRAKCSQEIQGETIMSQDTNGTAAQNATRVVNIELRKHYIRSVQENVALEHIAEMIKSTNGSKWVLELQSGNGTTEWYRPFGNYPTDVALYFTLTGPNDKDADFAIQDRIHALQEAGAKQRRGWAVHSVNGETWKPMSADERLQRSQARAEGTIPYAEVSYPSAEDRAIYFKEMIGVDAQVRMLCNYMEKSITSDFRSRSHAVLLGPPGCGKSKTLMLAKAMFPAEAVLVIDGTSMTSAGITKLLDELNTLPRFIIVEEIDKAPNDAVAVLLGLMDLHGELNKRTFRTNIQKECRVSVFATANSWDKLSHMQEGALISRFGNPITYTRPNPEQMRQILRAALEQMEIKSKNSEKWIERTMAWCNEWKDKLVADTQDPRFQISMVLNGQDQLLNGRYQGDLEATSLMRETVHDFS